MPDKISDKRLIIPRLTYRRMGVGHHYCEYKGLWSDAVFVNFEKAVTFGNDSSPSVTSRR